MNKQEIKNHLLQSERELRNFSEMTYDDHLKGSEVSVNEVVDMDAQSQADSSTELSMELDQQIHIFQERIQAIKTMSVLPSTSVEMGAIVEVNGLFLIISTAFPAFNLNGKKYMGVSPKAPLYTCMKGKKSGDSCQFNGIDFKIQNIY